jgi:hypothetical protein
LELSQDSRQKRQEAWQQTIAAARQIEHQYSAAADMYTHRSNRQDSSLPDSPLTLIPEDDERSELDKLVFNMAEKFDRMLKAMNYLEQERSSLLAENARLKEQL